jgi:YesN/AraC family two-component response regulator
MHNLQFASFNELINNINIKVLEHGYVEAQSDWQYFNVNSPFNRLYFVVSGAAKVFDNNKQEVNLLPGNIYLVPLYKTFNYLCEESLCKFYIHFRVELLAGHDLFENVDQTQQMAMEQKDLDTLLLCIQRRSIGDLLQLKSIFLKYISYLVQPFSEKLKSQENISPEYVSIYEYVENNCYGDLRVKNIAKHMNLPLTNLSKNFKAHNGITLKEFMDKKLIQKSQDLLLVTKLSIKEIAHQLRFQDEFYFSRYFKKHTGMSPSQYRKRNNVYY